MNRTKSLFRVGLIASGILITGAKISRGDIIVSDLSQNAVSGEYQYNVEVEPSSTLDPNDGFVIYDFPGLISGGSLSSISAGSLTLTAPDSSTLDYTFSLSQWLLGNSVYGLTPSGSNTPVGYVPNRVDNDAALDGTDSPSIENLSFVYNGSSVTTAATEDGGHYSGVLTLFTSIAGPSASVSDLGVFSSKDSSASDQYASGNVSVPVPEPTGVVVLGTLAIALGVRRSRRATA